MLAAETISLVSIICAPIGGFSRANFTIPEDSGAPSCINNCTSSALVSGQCAESNLTCQCTSPNYLNSLGPCSHALCSAADNAAFTKYAYATCATVGGIGPYNISQIQGYLLYTVPNGTAPAVPLLNSTSSSATTVMSTPSATIVPFTGAAIRISGTIRERWEMVLIVTTIGLVLMW